MVSKPKKRSKREKRPPDHADAGKGGERKGSRQKRGRYEHTVFRDWCKACGICSAFCPRHVIGRDQAGAPIFERPEECIGCRFCELRCPDFAITVKERDTESEKGES